VRTYSPKASEISRDWWVIDAEGMVLGRLATEVARVLRGKHKPTFSPNLDGGDHVIIVNADKVRKPAEAVRRTVKGMLPKNRLGAQMLTKLKVYAGPTHPHSAQQPKQLEIDPRAKARVS
jgi:large subunit ribosomal protein L13